MRKMALVVTAGVFLALVLVAGVRGETAELEEARALNEKVVQLYQQGRYREALPLAQRVLEIRQKILGEEHPDTAQSLNNLALLYEAIGAYDQALPLYQRALKIREKVRGPDHPDTAQSLHNLAGLYQAIGAYDKALPLYQRALKIREKVRGPEHPDTARSLNNLAGLYQDMGSYDKALPLYQRALQIREKVLGPEHPDTATSLNNLAELYRAMGAYNKALPLYQRALKISEKVLGPEHLDTAGSLNNLAALYRVMGVYDKALPLYQRALQIKEEVLGPEHPDTALSLNNLAALYQFMGAYDQALPLYQRALQIYEKVRGPEHPHTATSIKNLAFLYETLGALDKALPLYQRALEISEKALGPEHPDTATSLNSLAGLYRAMGAYDQALPLYQRALKIREKVLGAEHPDTANNLNNLALLYQDMGSYDQALPLYQRALKIYEKVLEPEHPDTARTLGNLGHLYLKLKDFQQAEVYFKRGKSKVGLVELYLATGRATEALGLLKGMIPTWRDTTTYQIQYHTQQGLALAEVGRLGEAAATLVKAVAGIEALRRRVAGERAGFFQAGYVGGYLRAYRGLVAVLANLALKGEALPPDLQKYGPKPESVAFYFAEATKARVLLETLAEAARKTSRVEIPADLRQKEEALQHQLAALEAQGEKALKGGEEALKEVQQKKEKLNAELQTLLKELRQNHPLYAALHYPQPLPPEDLPLKAQEVLLAYALTEEAGYVFVVRRGGVRQIHRIPLGREALEGKVKAFMAPLVNQQPDKFSLKPAKELYDLLLAGPLAEVKETDQVIIVPDGILGLLPFEALVIKEGAGLTDSLFVGDKYTLSYYQSATVLALQRRLQAPQARRTLFALGHPVFAQGDARYQAYLRGGKPVEPGTAPPKLAAFRARATYRDEEQTDKGERGGKELRYLPLPETEAEVTAIAKILGVPPTPPDVLLNLEANETWLRKSPLGEYRYLHFATHADLAGKVQGLKEPFILLGQVGNHPGDDGFLTLGKVLGLRLQADMVVLSACVTGRGQLIAGEGVANFARAFQYAGARSVVVSLWEVASLEAVEFMVAFYSHLKQGKSRSEALQRARREIKAKYPNPFFWAVFILHGEG